MRFRQHIMESEFRFEGKSVGVMTAHNPNGKPAATSKNKKLNTNLWNELRAAGYDPWPTKGKYKGHDEDSFLIPNISREDMIRLAAKYEQEAVVWARKADKGYAVEWIEGTKTIKRDKIASIRSLISHSVEF